MRSIRSVGRSSASAAGVTLAALTRLVAALRRPSSKPLHPHGSVDRGHLRRFGSEQPTGVPWLDGAGVDDVLVRRSRAVGLPRPVPDVHGLALRVPVPGGEHGDLLFASTGLGRVTRFVLTVGTRPEQRPMTTLLPYRTVHGPVLLAAVPRSDQGFDLAWAGAGGDWCVFASLTIEPGDVTDALVSFDPVRNTVPGLETYEWVRRMREPSYRTARRSR